MSQLLSTSSIDFKEDISKPDITPSIIPPVLNQEFIDHEKNQNVFESNAAIAIYTLLGILITASIIIVLAAMKKQSVQTVSNSSSEIHTGEVSDIRLSGYISAPFASNPLGSIDINSHSSAASNTSKTSKPTIT
ncbi:hypothetical protein NEPAR04_0661 [Nematocida parisii]|nr:hypothetical protein NEPAR03_0664 [Nematocida parisii]KAI5126913.1 hypothetical protein NEPAR08_0663 [Nematocida parisii]KAI5141023.1 hypothetical protein NEPAR04_0661 [Nematocida parisii]